ncbi:MAG: CRISPR-associated helicase Cas3' [Sumerlaeia bacterium]
MAFYAHTPSDEGSSWELFADHVEAVRERAVQFARPLGLEQHATVAALLHDLGKLTELFQLRLEGKARGVDHWTCGAAIVGRLAAQYPALADGRVAAAIRGHHVGLEEVFFGDRELAEEYGELRRQSQRDGSVPRWPPESDQDLLGLLKAAGFDFGGALKPLAGLPPYETPPALAHLLDTRLLFSCLVDADFLATEAHFASGPDNRKVWRDAGPPLEPAKALARLEDHMAGVREAARRRGTAPKVMALREDLWEACDGAPHSPGATYTLSAPTGTGKTLAMLRFALSHAAAHGLRRVVMVIPYLTIIEQTAGIYREIFSEAHGFPPDYVLEHHSQAFARDSDSDDDVDLDNADEPRRRTGLLAENWDAPVIVTTSVQALESLFADRPSRCRKLHQLAQSVILFDEVQTLPSHLAVPTLAALSHLAARYGSTVVFFTATQPAFAHLDPEVRTHANSGWRPPEIVAPQLGLFERSRRVTVDWTRARQDVPWEEMVAELATEPNRQVLAVLNLKAHARHVARELAQSLGKGHEGGEVFHLSTAMAPAHRERTLRAVRARLEAGEPCRLVATQCVEAGVDLDFPRVYRALAPLDSIAQAAGRCNRGGRLERGEVVIFKAAPLDGARSVYPPGYGEAVGVTEGLLAQHGDLDLADPALFTEAYRRLYDLAKAAELEESMRLALEQRHCGEVARAYRLIEADTISLVVPDPEHAALFGRLRDELASGGVLTRKWIARARPLTVTEYRPRGARADVLHHVLEPVPLGFRGKQRVVSEDWFVACDSAEYDPLVGFVPPKVMEMIL